jgi:5-formyltetrahydrofolate cyclo-ligase
METFFCEQASLALPVVLGVGKPLIFRNWSPGDELVKGPYKIDEPSSDARETVPELVLVPLLGFDEVGRRLGYGGGYYDRTLARLKQSGSVKLVGLAYEAQKLSRVPADTYDVSLDYVVTDQTCYRCN